MINEVCCRNGQGAMAIEPFEDEVDCAILCNSKFDNLMDELQHVDPRGEYSCGEEEEVVDVKIEYDNIVPETDLAAIDADDIIAAERDIMYNANDDDELIDIATNYDDGTGTIEIIDED